MPLERPRSEFKGEVFERLEGWAGAAVTRLCSLQKGLQEVLPKSWPLRKSLTLRDEILESLFTSPALLRFGSGSMSLQIPLPERRRRGCR